MPLMVFKVYSLGLNSTLSNEYILELLMKYFRCMSCFERKKFNS